LQPRTIAKLIREAAEDKKAIDPVVLDISKLTSIAHYFFVTHGASTRQVVAIAEHIVEKLREKKKKAIHVEGLEDGKWVLIDFGSVIAHIFHRETREFYALERLWGEARELK